MNHELLVLDRTRSESVFEKVITINMYICVFDKKLGLGVD